ncbi:hypothetical protein J2782_002233 [Brucella pseudogrignonensis]|uniref:Uncharacterized protein n=1 Tax=Brucella pseudogrignonensis TaxID=419475 RepID=A0ABU1M8W6_9HYPH|nr:hypothetical protein [Brucella pseudogrignonensis]
MQLIKTLFKQSEVASARKSETLFGKQDAL